MPSTQTSQVILPITAADAIGNITVASTSGILPGANGTVVDAAGTTILDVIVASITATTIRLKPAVPPVDGYFHGPNYGYKDYSSFSGGTFTQYVSVVPTA
jgi:hypothetical protein